MFSVVMLMVALMGMVLGASAGYEATSLDETQFSYEDGAIISPDGREEISYPEQGDGELEAIVNTVARTLTDIGMELGMSVADVTATWVYNNQWMPQIVFSAFFRVAGLFPLAWVGFRSYSMFRQL